MRNTDFNFAQASPCEQSEDWKDSDELDGSEKSDKESKEGMKDVDALLDDAIVISPRSMDKTKLLGIESIQGTAEGTHEDDEDSNNPSMRKQKIRRSNNQNKQTRLEKMANNRLQITNSLMDSSIGRVKETGFQMNFVDHLNRSISNMQNDVITEAQHNIPRTVRNDLKN